MEAHRVNFSLSPRGLSQIERAALWIVNKETKRKHAASIDALIRTRLTTKDGRTRGFILERNSFFSFPAGSSISRFVIAKVKLSAIRKPSSWERHFRLGTSTSFSPFDAKPSVLRRKFQIDLSIFPLDQAIRPGFRSLGWDERSLGLFFGIKDDDIHFFKLDGTIDHAILAGRRIAVELVRIHPAEILGFPGLWIIREKVCRRKSSAPDFSIRSHCELQMKDSFSPPGCPRSSHLSVLGSKRRRWAL